jgi:hypothetical protein
MRKKYIFIASFFFIMGIILSHTYRPYIYENHLFDFHLADTIGNWVAVPASLFFLSGVQKKTFKIHRTIPIIVVTYILYEFAGIAGLHGTFDIFDILATIISGIITYVSLYYIFGIKEL